MEVWGGNSRVDRKIRVPGLNVWVYSRPYNRADAGGDVYYLSSCASGRISRLLLADVSGHGESVASVASDLRDLMSRNVNWVNQARFVGELNRQFSGGPAGESFATAVVCTFFSPTRSLQLCNAGHPFPMVFREERQEWTSAADLVDGVRRVGSSDTPLGVIPEADYSRFDTKLSTGDMVLCVSDAFTESFDVNGDMLGMDGLMRIIRQLEVSRPDEIIPSLMDRIVAEHQANLCQDDATVILFRADGSSPSVSDNIMAPLRMLGGVRDNTGISET
jgi:serine phosphatase RsbU (regulator of sigma subunit)